MSEPSQAVAQVPFLELQGISKVFPGIRALERVNLTLRAGEVLGLMGENGAGKSTLIKIIGGIYQPDEGQLLLDGRPVRFRGVHDSLAAGTSLIHQELNLAASLSVAENIFLGKQPYRGSRWFQVTDRRRMARRSAELLEQVGLACSPWTPVGDLSIGQQQLVEIAKALASAARLIVFDEPTSSLSFAEASRLLALIGTLRASGRAILYVSHRIEEVRQLADRVAVLRDGRLIGELEGAAIERARIVGLMVGRDIRQFYHHGQRSIGSGDALRVTRLRYRAAREPISFRVAEGEIVGLAGLVGAGRTELARALYGVDPILAGRVEVKGKTLHIRDPRDAIAAGLLMVPEERKTQGLVLQDSVSDNITLAALPRLGCGVFRRRSAEHRLARQQARALAVRCAGLDQCVALLSGGNQQKVVLAKWLALAPAVLLLDEPTRGVDVGAKSEIYALIADLAGAGVGILLISSEMEEVLGVCDRVLVMHEGALRGELAGPALTETNVLSLALGGTP